MPVMCPSCSVEPDDGVAGQPCERCGTKLLAYNEPRDELIGSVIDNRFEILAKLGKGGMGTVYRAKQRSIGREVAIKLIDREYEGDQGAVKRFYREAQLASQLSHPNSVSVIEFGQNGDGRLYLAMELVRGQTLHAIVREQGALPVWRVVRIGVQLCDVLEAAHKLTIIHRDLKLENVMVVDRDLVKVLDFGLARSLADPNSRATMTGVITGTPRYLPPEVVTSAADPAPAQDVYALGVLLGELAVGHELWRAPTIEALLVAKLEVKPKLDGAHPGLRVLVEKLLAIEPADRPSLTEVRVVLQSLDDIKLGKVTPPAGVPVTPALDPTQHKDMPSKVSRGDLVDLGEVVKPPVETTAVDTSPPHGTDPPPAEPEPVLEVDAEWKAEKAARAARPFPEPVVARRSPVLVAGVIVVVGGLGAGGWHLATHRAKTRPDAVVQSGLDAGTARTVTVKITGSATDVRIDGARAGNAPLTYQATRGTTIVVTGSVDGAHVMRQVTADADQSIELR
jgi:serine/threonine protein kinase